MAEAEETIASRSDSSDVEPSNQPSEIGETGLLLTYLRGRDVACPVCGYNLRNLTRAVCPECAEPLSLAVRAADRPMWAFIFAITPGLFSGVSAVLFGFMLCVVIPRSGLPPRWWWPFAIEAFGVASVIFAVMLYRRRRVFLLLAVSTQLIWAALIWIVHVTAFVAAVLIGPV